MGTLDNLKQHEGSPAFAFNKVDVRDQAALREAFSGVDTIVRLAAFKIPRYGNTIETLDVNTLGTRHALEISRFWRRNASPL
jgi:UDP-glucose 4-epimerase